MPLKKTMAGYYKDIEKEDGSKDRVWIEQVDIDMHPLEEESIRKFWAIHEVRKSLPEEITKEQEHEWLIEHGAEYVKQKRDEYRVVYEAARPELEAVQKAHQKAHDEWCAHAEHCVLNGLCPDTHDKEKHLYLIEKYKD